MIRNADPIRPTRGAMSILSGYIIELFKLLKLPNADDSPVANVCIQTFASGTSSGLSKLKTRRFASGFSVPRTGFEPAHLAAPPPEDGASTNFATWAPEREGKYRAKKYRAKALKPGL